MPARLVLPLFVALGLAACSGASSSKEDVPMDVAGDAGDPLPDIRPRDALADHASPHDLVRPDTLPDDDVPAPADAAPDATTGDAQDAAPHDVVADAGSTSFVRTPAGEPLSAEELAATTDRYLDLLRGTRWFAVIAERAHGWPRSDPEGRFWYGTWWSGVRVLKEDGAVRYVHPPDGSDNNGLRTGPILSGVCYGHTLWGGQEPLLRTLVRGFEAWALAMERESRPDTGVLLSRSFYPPSVLSTDDGRSIYIDYDACRPGEDWQGEGEPPSVFVHNPDNPWWGEIWVKNKRSKDDVGHMLLALSALPGCTAEAGPELAADVARAEAIYMEWSRRVEDDGWRIATVDQDWQLFFPTQDLGFFLVIGNIECTAPLALRLYGRGDAGALECGDGIGATDELWQLKDDFHEIQRSFHAAAAAIAALRGHPEVREALLPGLAWRIERLLDNRDAPNAPPDRDVAELIAVAASAGLPLTWREVRFLHERIAEAHAGFLTDALRPSYDVFAPATPDGEYVFTPEGGGLRWRYLPAALGTCASPLRSPASAPALDCERLRANPPW